MIIDINVFQEEREKEEKAIIDRSKHPSKYEQLARSGEEHPEVTETIIKVIKRNPYVKLKVKERASGKCELCGNNAPFANRNDEPFLEVHHLVTLSNNGPDTVYNTVALCPNCHRQIHYGDNDINSQSYKKLVQLIKNSLLIDDDMDNYCKLIEFHHFSGYFSPKSYY